MEKPDWKPFAIACALLATIFAAVAIPYARRYSLPTQAAAGIYTCFLLLLCLALLPGTQWGQALLIAKVSSIRSHWRTLPAFLLFCIPYLLYATAARDFHLSALLHIAVVALVPPSLYLAFPPRRPERFSFTDAAVGCFLIAVVLGRWLGRIWNVPIHLDFMSRLLLIAVCATTWTALRPVPHLNYRLQLHRKVLSAAALNFLYFACLAIPAGLLLKFIAWHPRWHGFPSFALDYLEIFLFIALLEELFFRGFLQSLLAGSFASPRLAQALATLVFGLFHILHAPIPNWRYVALAAVAGWFYGQAYRDGGTLLASALTHAAVDTVWRTWLTV